MPSQRWFEEAHSHRVFRLTPPNRNELLYQQHIGIYVLVVGFM
jgi:hypothetical protein